MGPYIGRTWAACGKDVSISDNKMRSKVLALCCNEFRGSRNDMVRML
jgi:hypothetical protein